MKKVLSWLFLIVILFGCVGDKSESIPTKRILLDQLTNKGTEESPLLYYESGLYNGVGFDVYPNGNISIEANFKEGKLHGVWKSYNLDNEIWLELEYFNGLRNGIVNKSGYADCLCTGVFEFNPVLWINDKSISPEKRRDSDIIVTSKEVYKLGERHGEYKRWYENGQLQFEGSFSNDKLNGMFLAFDLNGKKNLELRYVNGELIEDLTEIVEEEIIEEQIESTESIVTQSEIETPAVKTTEQKKVIEKVYTQKEVIEEKKPEVNKKAIYTGKKKTKNNSEGKKNGEGNQGVVYEEGGIGENGIAYQLGGRQVIEKPTPETSQIEGKVVVMIIVNRLGNVIYASPGGQGSTTFSKELLERSKVAALKTKFEEKPDAPEKQHGKIIYNFVLD